MDSDMRLDEILDAGFLHEPSQCENSTPRKNNCQALRRKTWEFLIPTYSNNHHIPNYEVVSMSTGMPLPRASRCGCTPMSFDMRCRNVYALKSWGRSPA
jgi:hypothetical protein